MKRKTKNRGDSRRSGFLIKLSFFDFVHTLCTKSLDRGVASSYSCDLLRSLDLQLKGFSLLRFFLPLPGGSGLRAAGDELLPDGLRPRSVGLPQRIEAFPLLTPLLFCEELAESLVPVGQWFSLDELSHEVERGLVDRAELRGANVLIARHPRVTLLHALVVVTLALQDCGLFTGIRPVNQHRLSLADTCATVEVQAAATTPVLVLLIEGLPLERTGSRLPQVVVEVPQLLADLVDPLALFGAGVRGSDLLVDLGATRLDQGLVVGEPVIHRNHDIFPLDTVGEPARAGCQGSLRRLLFHHHPDEAGNEVERNARRNLFRKSRKHSNPP